MDRYVASSGNFGVADYIVFGISIGFALLVGLYHTVKDIDSKSLSNYYYGNKIINPIPIGISMSVTFISSLTVIGMPEMGYSKGSIVLWMSFAALVPMLPAYFYFIPFLHQVQLASVYEFLEIRFHVTIRRLTSFFSIVNQIMYMAIAIYLTALALAVVAPISFTVSVLLTCGVVTFYTVLGGIKAVIWVDFFQSFIMVAGCIALFIKTSSDVGGLDHVWKALERGRRDTFLTFNPDPTFTLSAWTMIFGLGLNWASVPCCNQAIVQRFQSCKSVKGARIALLAFTIPLWCLLFNAGLNGCVMYAYFENCDPLKAGLIQDKNQYIPFLVANIFRTLPGMAGLFVSAAYSGMLSTVSSGMNALSNLITEDFIRPFVKPRSNKRWLNISKFTGIILGVVICMTTFLIRKIGSRIIVLAFSIDGILGGPIFGLFIAGLFIPLISTRGAGVGFVCAIATTMWISIGSKVYGVSSESSFNITPTSVSMCSNSSLQTSTIQTNITTINDRPYIADTLYSISYMYYGVIGTSCCILYSVIASLILGKNDSSKMDPMYFIPLCTSKRLPKKIRKALRFGVPELEEKQELMVKEYSLQK